MEYIKQKGSIVISKINNKEFGALIKSQIPMTIAFFDHSGQEIAGTKIVVFERLLKGNQQAIRIGDATNPDYVVSYSTIIGKLTEYSDLGYIFKIRIKELIFKQKEALIAIASGINSAIAANCVCLDYTDGMFSIINKPFPNGDSDKLYYFEDNNSILGFTKSGPALIMDSPKVQSIEDILCA